VKLTASLARVLRNERASTALLLPVAALALLLAPHGLSAFFHNQLSFGGLSFTIRDWVALAPLVIFFYVAGLELRSGFGNGEKLSSSLPPIAGAICGMAVPALIYLLLAHSGGINSSAWGIPMATDLPLALAALNLFPKQVSNEIRSFILTLAIFDDVGSIVVIAVRFHQRSSLTHSVLAIISLLGFGFLFRRRFKKWRLLKAAALLSLALIVWWEGLHSGIHPTVFGVLLGLATPLLTIEKTIQVIQPFSSFLIIPLFLFSSLSIMLTMPISRDLTKMTAILIAARFLGKPLGIVCGAWGLAHLLKIDLGFAPAKLWLVGILGIFGFSVSLLFAQLTLTGAELNAAILGILLALPVGGATTLSYYFFTRATAA